MGFSLINDTSFAGKNVSTHYQFEGRLGIVAKASDFSNGLRYLHYSNAGFKRPNPGLDFISLSFAKRF
ncbi:MULTISPECIES: acyloxyacyl hydrolase [unclassified Pseudoalteromonas]|uniref:acyloxyacyl hydrolase n=1 Tax=unclassified Pseudoalteromonas TaxID=194690 RepID=UPI00235128E9|nr:MULTISPECIES: acyloxyacyl hydrolase [unclassified Pseudoalteromonas]MDP2635387.1 acyloxyacyl hydrolase [Pseudoalteromonas sp. 1_MG-2023]